MKESKRYVVMGQDDMVKATYINAEEAEKAAAQFAKTYSTNKYYVAEIYCFYQTTQPIQRIDLV